MLLLTLPIFQNRFAFILQQDSRGCLFSIWNRHPFVPNICSGQKNTGPIRFRSVFTYVNSMPRKKKRRSDITDEQAIQDVIATLHKTNIKLKKFNFSEKQKELLKILFDKKTNIVFVSGPAGTSKTFMAIYGALQLFNMNNEYGITYVRTIAESGDKSLGSLPGEMQEKINPYMMPMNDKLDELLYAGQAQVIKENDIIKGMPINYLRGASWLNEIIIADESQNFTLKELTTLMTRLGKNSKLFICGDSMQSDINGKSGFSEMRAIFDDSESKRKGIHCFDFGVEDIKRSEILKFIISKLQHYKK
jgi:phosphate starvation-inducible protein PhoH